MLEKWNFCITLFVKDIDFVQKEYNEQRETPPIARNLPPIAGRIAWCRQLYRRLTEPVDIFRRHTELMALPDTRKAIKSYNRLAKNLVEYEVVFLRIWNQQVQEARSLLNSTILVRDPESGRLLVNIDKKVFEMIREVDTLQMMGFEIPIAARNFAAMDKALKTKFDGITVSKFLGYNASLNCILFLQLMIEQNDRIRGRIPEIFKTLMEPHLEKVDEVISPGLTVLRWTSLNIEAFLQSVEGSLTELELLVERVSNTMEFQIEGVLQDIQNTVLCDLPDNEAWTVDEFFNRTQVSKEGIYLKTG